MLDHLWLGQARSIELPIITTAGNGMAVWFAVNHPPGGNIKETASAVSFFGFSKQQPMPRLALGQGPY